MTGIRAHSRIWKCSAKAALSTILLAHRTRQFFAMRPSRRTCASFATRMGLERVKRDRQFFISHVLDSLFDEKFFGQQSDNQVQVVLRALVTQLADERRAVFPKSLSRVSRNARPSE